jgi:NADH dehydrogenase
MRSRVIDIDREGVTVQAKDGGTARHSARVVLWTAGVAAPPVAQMIAKATGAPTDRAGRIKVRDDLTIPGHPEIYVAGDLMSLRELPGVAETAMQSGHYAGRRIRRTVAGQHADKPFRYHDLGSAAYISRGRGVLSTGPFQVSGFLGWLGWLFIHIAFLTGYRNRAGAILTWWSAFTRDSRRERTFTPSRVGFMENVYGRPALTDIPNPPGGAPPPAEAQPAEAEAQPAEAQPAEAEASDSGRSEKRPEH